MLPGHSQYFWYPEPGQVYILNRDGVYEGPGRWRRVVKLDENDWELTGSKNGTVFAIRQITPGNIRFPLPQQLIYDPATEKTTEVEYQYGSTDRRFRGEWTEITNQEDSWASGLSTPDQAYTIMA